MVELCLNEIPYPFDEPTDWLSCQSFSLTSWNPITCLFVLCFERIIPCVRSSGFLFSSSIPLHSTSQSLSIQWISFFLLNKFYFHSSTKAFENFCSFLLLFYRPYLTVVAAAPSSISHYISSLSPFISFSKPLSHSTFLPSNPNIFYLLTLFPFIYIDCVRSSNTFEIFGTGIDFSTNLQTLALLAGIPSFFLFIYLKNFQFLTCSCLAHIRFFFMKWKNETN